MPLTAIVIVGGLALVAAGWWVRFRCVVVTVSGESMSPTYRPGDRLLVRRTTVIRRGDCVVFAEPPDATIGLPGGWVVKRVAALPGDTGHDVPHGHLLVLGDNPAHSYDSRHFGPVAAGQVRGVVRRRLSSMVAIDE